MGEFGSIMNNKYLLISENNKCSMDGFAELVLIAVSSDQVHSVYKGLIRNKELYESILPI